jgi:dTDP-4-dehydrorhamnose reductase
MQVGEEIVRLLNQSPGLLEPVSVTDVPLRAIRPRYAALSNQKLRQAGFAMPSWQDALARYLERVGG